MKTILTITALVALAGFAAADCPNACSGHGDCNSNWDYCNCYHGFIGADCSQRLCQFGLSWIDTPQGDLNHDNTLSGGYGDDTAITGARPAGTPSESALNPMWRFEGWWERHPAALYGTNDQRFDLPFYVRPQEGHFYAECSNRGLCNRATGLCDCLTGYEGAACNRTTCQNDCSGHGTCQTVREVTPSHLHYRLWDADKTRICECDGGYFGMDCSQRACMKDDDPLTVTTTREDYNDGLTEANEVQIVEVRCPFGGAMLDPSISLTYTDVQFGDKYETARFDPTDATADVVGALKALPNQVLADYVVDGATVTEKVISAAMTALETDNHYMWRIEFDEHLGDVPLLGATAYFKCTGGAEVSTLQSDGTYSLENIAVTFSGDGPATFLEIDGDIASNDQFTYVVKDAAGNPLADTTDLYVLDDAAKAFTANPFSRELEKVSLNFGDTAAAAGGTVRGHLNIKIHVDPVVSSRNINYVLSAAANRNIDLSGGGNALTLDTTESTPAYDQHHHFEVIDSTTAPAVLARWSVNGEFWMIVDIPAASGAIVEFQSAGTGGVATYPTNGRTYVSDLGMTGAVGSAGDFVGDFWEFYSAKTPAGAFYQAVPAGTDGTTPIDVINLQYTNAKAPPLAVPIVIQVVRTHTVQDLYRWKTAGDTEWVVPQGVGVDPGFPMLSTFDNLGEINYYLNQRYPDDPMRQGLASVEIAFTAGADNDERICTTSSTSRNSKYYVQIGSQGLNDAPECSDRGVCDYNTGTCRCFKGYASENCQTQAALAAGYTGTSSAF